MGRTWWRYGWATVLGAVVGFGWWSWYRFPEAVCAPGGAGFGCELGWVLALPAVPLVSWSVAWFALHRLHVDRPGVTGASGVGVAVLLHVLLAMADTTGGAGSTADPGTPSPVWLVGMGAVSFLIGAMLSSRPVYPE
ncbi:hypothetical protein AB0G02_00160 [Actinosynnema sp. NPDC023658]|uniref:hypothetical protein n=1 Tax=Actinosynnema sp. NPDC023658 TaxID=3155465 RepID=UPI0033CBE8F2